MTTEDRHLHKAFRDAAEARGWNALRIVEACKDRIDVNKFSVWAFWQGKHYPAFRRIVEVCRVVGIDFFIKHKDKLHKVEFDDRKGRKGHGVVLGDVVNVGDALDGLKPDQRDIVLSLADNFRQQNRSKKYAAGKPAKRKAARAA